MNWKQILQKQFGEIILDVKNEFAFSHPTLTVVLNKSNIEEVDKYTMLINAFLDANFEDKMNFDVLNILSKGTEIEIPLEELSNFKDTFATVTTKKSINGLNKINGQILHDRDNVLQLKWNNKGQFRTLKIEHSNILKVEKYIKF